MTGPAGALGRLARYGLGWVQGLIALAGAGSVLFEAHRLFLRYYAKEWGGIQISGVNGCQGEDLIANGDLFSGETFCHEALNFVPWIVVYRNHWQVAAAYYGAILIVLLLVGILVLFLQPRQSATKPFGSGQPATHPRQHEHFR